MKPRDYITLLGGLMLGLGTFTLQQDVPVWAWWAAKFSTIAGPILLSARAVTAGRVNRQINKNTKQINENTKPRKRSTKRTRVLDATKKAPKKRAKKRTTTQKKKSLAE